MSYINRGISGSGLRRIAKALKKRATMYSLKLTAEELESLAYIADRYEYARILYDALEPVEGDQYEVHQSDAWAFEEAVMEEDGHMPLMGEPLLSKVEDFLQQIV